MSLYTRKYYSYYACDAAAQEFSKHNPGCYYVNRDDCNAWEISTLEECEGDPYWRNGVLVYPYGE